MDYELDFLIFCNDLEEKEGKNDEIFTYTFILNTSTNFRSHFYEKNAD